ncbi:MAG TPA: hypothetical protein VGN20_11845 [Mucilaginibacter sp.]|jgi:hypothetical protein
MGCDDWGKEHQLVHVGDNNNMGEAIRCQKFTTRHGEPACRQAGNEATSTKENHEP